MRAVHGFEHVLFALLRGLDGLEGILSVLCPVTGGDVELLASDVRSNHLHVVLLIELGAQELLQLVAHHGAAGQPQGQAQTDAVAECEELHLLAEFAVIPLLGLFQQHQVLVQHALLGEGDAIDTGELLTVLVSAPVGSGNGGELHRLDDVGVAEMRAAAKIREGSVCIVGDGAVGKLADELALVLVALRLEMLHGVCLGDFDPGEILLTPGEFEHFLLHLGKVCVCDGAPAEVYVIVEAVFDCGADSELNARIDGFEGFCHEV